MKTRGVLWKVPLAAAASGLGVLVFFPMRTAAAIATHGKEDATGGTEQSAEGSMPAGDATRSISEGGKSGGGGSSHQYKTCEDMYDRCQEIGGKCTKGYPGCDKFGQTSCGRCLEACKAGAPYPPECKCRKCGFTE